MRECKDFLKIRNILKKIHEVATYLKNVCKTNQCGKKNFSLSASILFT